MASGNKLYVGGEWHDEYVGSSDTFVIGDDDVAEDKNGFYCPDHGEFFVFWAPENKLAGPETTPIAYCPGCGRRAYDHEPGILDLMAEDLEE